MRFSKLVAAGNDFILVDGFKERAENWNEVASKVCNRHFGVGADGLMYCSKSEIADIKMHYYNSDGSRAEMCGNGIRCFSKFVYDNVIIEKDEFSVETDAGIKYIKIVKDEMKKAKYITVNMGKVDFKATSVPCKGDKDLVLNENISIKERELKISSVRMGVPHTVIFVDDYDKCDINFLGREIEKNSFFKEGTNVNFSKKIDESTLMIKTWERGAGRTLGCGTGCCATGAVAYKLGLIKNDRIKMVAEGGEIIVEIGEDYEITMSGEAKLICVGEFF